MGSKNGRAGPMEVFQEAHERFKWYKQDWQEGVDAALTLVASAVYIFFISLMKALAFGEQIASNTNSEFKTAHILASTAIAGVVQSLFGGQPLVILSIPAPHVIVFGYVYSFMNDRDALHLFRPFIAYMLMFAGLMLTSAALAGIARVNAYVTRAVYETFGCLIALFLFRQGLRGIVQEFNPSDESGPGSEGITRPWRIINGLWSLILSMLLLLIATVLTQARSWTFWNRSFRGFLSDYGAPLTAVLVTAISYAIPNTDYGVPRRSNNSQIYAEEISNNFSVLTDLDIPGRFIGMAIIPGFIICVLTYFDHTVSSMLSQQEDFGLKRPLTYGYDLFVEGVVLIILGMLGLPPSSGVLPQSPLHTRSLLSIEPSKLEKMLNSTRRGLVRTLSSVARSQSSQHFASSHDQLSKQSYWSGNQASEASLPSCSDQPDTLARVEEGEAKDDGINRVQSGSTEENQPSSIHTGIMTSDHSAPTSDESGERNGTREEVEAASMERMKEPSSEGVDATPNQPEVKGQRGTGIPVNVREQRLSALYHALLCALSLFIAPVLRLVPRAALHGYFLAMAIWSLPGNQLWHRFLLLFKDPAHRTAHKSGDMVPVYVYRVPFGEIAKFTCFQLFALGSMFGISYAGQGGIAFPVVLLLLVPARHYLIPKIMDGNYVTELDRAKDLERVQKEDSKQVREERARDIASYFTDDGIGGQGTFGAFRHARSSYSTGSSTTTLDKE